MLPIRKKTVVFESFLGKQFSDNPKAIYDHIKEYLPDYRLYWSFDRNVYPNFDQHEIRAISRLSIRWIFIMARAEYWVTNSRLPLWIPKRKDTIYVQTWHGTPLKKLGLDIDEVHMPGTTTEKYKSNFTYEASKWDYLISPNAYSTDVFRSAFDYDKKIIESGYPRNDVLFTKNTKINIEQIKSQLNIPINKQVILYAPTWRDNDYHSIGKYRFKLHLDLSFMKDTLGDDYIILLRTHYLVADQIDLKGYEEFVWNLSHYSDISELYLISDILITDYSSVFFDYANLQRPILFYVYDIEEYREELRGFYLDFENIAPGPLVKTTEELVKKIKGLKVHDHATKYINADFIDKFCYLEDGNASKRIVNYLFVEK